MAFHVADLMLLEVTPGGIFIAKPARKSLPASGLVGRLVIHVLVAVSKVELATVVAGENLMMDDAAKAVIVEPLDSRSFTELPPKLMVIPLAGMDDGFITALNQR